MFLDLKTHHNSDQPLSNDKTCSMGNQWESINGINESMEINYLLPEEGIFSGGTPL